LQQLDHLVGQVEQAHEVAHRDAAAPDTPSDLLARQPELLDERRAGARLLDRAEVLARHVLDQSQLDRFGVVARSHERRNRLQAGDPRRAPAPLARHQLVRSAGLRANEHRLQHATLAQRSRPAPAASPRRASARLRWIGRDQLDRQLAQLLLPRPLAFRRDRQDRLQASPHARFLV